MFIIIHIAALAAGSIVFPRMARIEFAAIVTVVGITIGFALVGPLVLLGAPVTLMVLAQSATRIRDRRAGVVLSHLDQAVRMNLPLTSMLFAAADTERGPTRQRLNALAHSLESGTGLGDAIRKTVTEVNENAARLIDVGEWAGRIDPTLEYLGDRYTPVNNDDDKHHFQLFYTAMILMMVGLTVVGMTVMIIPKFNEIFKDFGTELPEMTQWMVDISSFMVWYAFSEILGGILIFVYFIVLIAMVERWWFGVVDWGASFRGIGSSIGSRIPGIGSMPRDRALAQVCFVLGEAARSGLRLDSAIDEAAHLKMPGIWRSRIATFGEGVRNGLEPGEAARAAQLPPIVSGMLGPAARGGDTAGAFEFLARYFDQRFSRAAALVRGAMVPAAVLTLGFIVGLTVLAMIMPLVALIDGVIANSGF